MDRSFCPREGARYLSLSGLRGERGQDSGINNLSREGGPVIARTYQQDDSCRPVTPSVPSFARSLRHSVGHSSCILSRARTGTRAKERATSKIVDQNRHQNRTTTGPGEPEDREKGRKRSAKQRKTNRQDQWMQDGGKGREEKRKEREKERVTG